MHCSAFAVHLYSTGYTVLHQTTPHCRRKYVQLLCKVCSPPLSWQLSNGPGTDCNHNTFNRSDRHCWGIHRIQHRSLVVPSNSNTDYSVSETSSKTATSPILQEVPERQWSHPNEASRTTCRATWNAAILIHIHKYTECPSFCVMVNKDYLSTHYNYFKCFSYSLNHVLLNMFLPSYWYW